MEWNLKAPVSGYQFQVLINQKSISFSKVQNLVMEQEYEQVQEGGTNDRVLLFRAPKAQADVLRLERGVWSGEAPKLVPGQRLRNLTILVLRNRLPVKIYAIDAGVVKSVTVSDLDALNGEVLIETMEILHTGMVPVKVI